MAHQAHYPSPSRITRTGCTGESLSTPAGQCAETSTSTPMNPGLLDEALSVSMLFSSASALTKASLMPAAVLMMPLGPEHAHEAEQGEQGGQHLYRDW